MSKQDWVVNAVVGFMFAAIVAGAVTVKAWAHDWHWQCVFVECRKEIP